MIDGHFSEFAKMLEHRSLQFFHEYEIIFGVHYLHVRLPDDSDIYLTRFGIHLIDDLIPPVFLTDRNWFKEHAQRLEGTSSTFKVKIGAEPERAEDLVVKWNRMGITIPVSDDSEELNDAEFNSPFEEFSMVMELRNAAAARSDTIITQLPFAIYVPSDHKELWRTGRKEYVLKGKLAKHKDEILLDMFRTYIVVYKWIDGIDAAQAVRTGVIDEDQMVKLTLDADSRLQNNGYMVKDRKPHHVIVRPRKNGRLAQTKRDGVLYGLIDYELLMRLPQNEKERNKQRRLLYHKKQHNRFAVEPDNRIETQYKFTNMLGVDYVFCHAESTGCRLWVAGNDADLIDFFLPERWLSQPKIRLSASHEIYHTITKDEIHLVWKVSKAGMLPNVDPYRKSDRRLIDHGFNTAFEEVSLALHLSWNNIRVVYPRAIYEVSEHMQISDSLIDSRRYTRFQDLLAPDGEPAFRPDRSYIILWGFYNGSDAQLAEKDGEFLESVDALTAFRKELISEKEYLTIIRRKRRKLHKIGVQDLNLHGGHLLLSMTPSGKLLRSGDGYPDVRICNFEFLKQKRPIELWADA